jgi:shikimate kinase/3-dehydroquinate synthase
LKANIFITGFSGSGKTTVGKEVARRLGWRFVDTDDEIVRLAGVPIAAIFAEKGEPRFRELEREALVVVASGERQVVSTGGGIIMDERNRRVMEENGVVVCLEARPETIYRRLEAEKNNARGPVIRPMLAASDPLARIRSLKAERQFNYTLSHWTVHTDDLTPEEAAEEVIRGWKMLSERGSEWTRPPVVPLTKGDEGESLLVKGTSALAGDISPPSPLPRGTTGGRVHSDADLAAVVKTASGDYPIWVGWGLIDELGERVKRILKPQVAYVITDEGVYHQARRAQVAMEAAGIPTHIMLIPPGERSKTLEMAQRIYEWLAQRKAERGHLVVAVGGGVVGDLAGFVAATFLRGMPFAQVPTSMLAMMDAAIGGKVAVDLPQGKNLVGAFYQPRFVLADVSTLQTLPRRELTSGWAEAIKHGLILDEGLLAAFESQRDAIQALEPEVATDIIRRSVAIKADVVSQDERETLGVRVLLNYGHTIGHALEAATGYGRFLHGEAVSIGMMGAAYISQAMGMLSTEEVERQRALLDSFGLPLSCGGVDIAVVSEAMRSDKKTSGRAIRWVLLDGIGRAVTRNDVPPELVQDILRRLAH